MNNQESSQKHFVTVGIKRKHEYKMRYTIFGNGESKILLIGGFLIKSKYQKSIAEYFQSLGKYTILTFDYVGIGDSESAKTLSVKSLASDTLELIEHIKWENLNVIGISLGSYVALELSFLSPERINTLNMTCPTDSLNFFNPTIINNIILKPMFDSFIYGVNSLDVLINTSISQSFLNAPSKIKNGTNKEFLYPLFENMSKDKVPLKSVLQHSFLATFYKLKPIDKEILLKRNFPVCVFIGTNDYFNHWENVIKTCDIIQPNKIFIAKGSGHLIPIENMDEYYNLSEHFFSYKPNQTIFEKELITMETGNEQPLDNPFEYRSTSFTKLPIFKKFKIQ